MKCIYCNELGHKIYNCDKGMELNNLLDKLIQPDFSKLTLKKLQRIASMNSIKIFLKKEGLVSEMEKIWNEKNRLRNIHFNTDECSICLDNIYNNNLSILPCGHKYHFNCIVDALKTKSNCPLCRADIDININTYVNEEEFNFFIEDNVNTLNTLILNNNISNNNRIIEYSNNIGNLFNYILNVIKIINALKNNPFVQIVGLLNFLYFVNNIYLFIIDDTYNFSYDFI